MHNGQEFQPLCTDATAWIRSALQGIAHTKRYFILGSGQVGKKMALALQEKGFVVAGFLDNNSALHETKIDGLPVWHREKFRAQPGDTCIIAIWRYHHNFAETSLQAAGCGFAQIFHFAAVAAYFDLPGIFPNYAVDHPTVIFNADFPTRFEALMQNLADARSRELAIQALRFFANPIVGNLPKPSEEPLPFASEAVRAYIDCGAFIGDDFELRREQFTGLANAQLIEPDAQSFQTLSHRNFAGISTVQCWHAAVSDAEGFTSFQNEGTWGSKMVANGGTVSNLSQIRTLTLDQFTHTPAPRYVKMDIEGAELQALQGASSLFADDSTIFSITVEHHAWDLFDISEHMAKFPHRRTYLYAHDTEFCMDLVLYSVPKPLIHTA